MTIEENVTLSGLTTFRIGGPARFMARVGSSEDLKAACAFAKEKQLAIFVLGGGSNILVNDIGFDGLVIKNELKGISIDEQTVVAGAGENWDELVAYTVEHGFNGLENLSLIPGTVGAAPVQNIGAYGSELKDTVAWVEALNIETGEIRRFNTAECQFDYRDSFFKKPEGKKYCIVQVAFNLKKDGVVNISYKDLAEYFKNVDAATVTVADVRNAVIAIRRRKLPDVKDYGTAGSFFKNPIISKTAYETLKQTYPLLPSFPVNNEFVKVPAGWILDNVCGFKGYRQGDAGVYQNQALVLVNYGKATGSDIKQMAEMMMSSVKSKTGINLEPEVQFV